MKRFLLSGIISLLAIGATTNASVAQAEKRVSIPFEASGGLDSGDRTLPDGSFYDDYTFEGVAGQIVAFILNSEDFDTYLVLVDETGQKLIENNNFSNDFSSSVTNSYLAIELPKDGTYRLLATSNSPAAVGQYSLFSETGDPHYLAYQGMAYLLTVEPEKALVVFKRSLALQEETADAERRSELLSYIGLAHEAMGEYVEAMPYAEASLALRREIGDQAQTARAATELGKLHANISDYKTVLGLYQESLDIYREIGDRDGEGLALNNMAYAYDGLGDYPKALAMFEQALAIALEDSDRYSESVTLSNIGGIYNSQSNYVKAVEFYKRALAISRELGDREGVASGLSNLGGVYNALGSYGLAVSTLEESLAIGKEITDPGAEASALGRLGLTYSLLADYDRAIDYHNQSLAVYRRIGDRRNESSALSNLGDVYDELGDYQRALTLHQQALAVSEEIEAPDAIALDLLKIGGDYENLEEMDKVLPLYERALAIGQEIGSQSIVGSALNSLGYYYQQTEDYDKALELYGPASAIFEEINSRKGIATLLNNVAFSFYSQGEVELSILFYKESVNTYEAIRRDLIGLDTELQTTYVDSVAYTYRQLADLLLQQGRVLEAQEVLELLKVQELEDYLDKRGSSASEGIGYKPLEIKLLARYESLQAISTELGQALSQLNARRNAGIITPEEDSRRLALEKQQAQLAEAFRNFASDQDVRNYVDQLSGRSTEPSVQEPAVSENRSSLQRDLAANEAVLLEMLILEDRLELLVTTENADVQQRTVPGVGKAEIDAAVTEFRRALQNPAVDAREIAQQFYSWLIEPIEEDLAAAGVETIIYSPDESLRYIPLSALYDGEQWLAERLSVNNITARSLTNLSTLPSNNPSILAGAFSDSSVEHIVRGTGYSGLPYAGREVTLLSDTLPGVTAFFDGDFSLGAIAPSAQGFNILHLATHASFVSTRPEESFILFGNGDTQTVEDISEWNLPNTDLVVLSACETGLGNFDNSGLQISGLGYQFQESGARAVMSSLWRVDDGGTQRLINAFYQGLEQGFSKSEAMQQAQKLLIENDLKAVDEMIAAGSGQTAAEQQTVALPKRLDHPYYWAPFVLMGNGL